jgi:hypothetical protein
VADRNVSAARSGQRFTTYKVKFDDARKYSPHSLPRFVTTLRLFRL